MFESGHARLLAAFIAAMGLHGLLFVLQMQQPDSSSYLSMQVEFLAQPQTSSAASVKQINSHEPIASAIQEKSLLPKPIIAKEVASKPVIHQQTVKLSEPAPTQETEEVKADINIKSKSTVVLKSNLPAQEQLEVSSGEDADMVMPVDIQKKILTQVSYPMRARRLGWEGSARFRINVRGQGVQQVMLLLSTGHALLDRAAQKGIASIESLPLGDGNYSFPVVFQLR